MKNKKISVGQDVESAWPTEANLKTSSPWFLLKWLDFVHKNLQYND